MKISLLLILSIMLGFSFNAQANKTEDQATKKTAKFEQRKALQLEKLAEKTAVFETLKKCVTASKDHKEHKACNITAKTKLKAMHEERKTAREAKKAEHKAKREAHMEEQQAKNEKKMAELKAKMEEKKNTK